LLKKIEDSKEDLKKAGYDEIIIADFFDEMISKVKLAGLESSI